MDWEELSKYQHVISTLTEVEAAVDGTGVVEGGVCPQPLGTSGTRADLVGAIGVGYDPITGANTSRAPPADFSGCAYPPVVTKVEIISRVALPASRTGIVLHLDAQHTSTGCYIGADRGGDFG